MQNVGDIVWIDGDTPAIVVGTGTDADNIGDGRVFVARLGTAEVIEPAEDGGYNFGSSPYDTNAGTDKHAQSVNPGGFGPDTPAAANAPAAGTTIDGGSPTHTGGYDPAGTDAQRVNAGAPTYTDNGDGTWTNEATGERGTFGPDGFAAHDATPPAGS